MMKNIIDKRNKNLIKIKQKECLMLILGETFIYLKKRRIYRKSNVEK